MSIFAITGRSQCEFGTLDYRNAVLSTAHLSRAVSNHNSKSKTNDTRRSDGPTRSKVSKSVFLQGDCDYDYDCDYGYDYDDGYDYDYDYDYDYCHYYDYKRDDDDDDVDDDDGEDEDTHHDDEDE